MNIAKRKLLRFWCNALFVILAVLLVGNRALETHRSSKVEFLLHEAAGAQHQWLTHEKREIKGVLRKFCRTRGCKFKNLAVIKSSLAVPGEECMLTKISVGNRTYEDGFEWPTSNEHAEWAIQCFGKALVNKTTALS